MLYHNKSSSRVESRVLALGPVVRKLVNANLGRIEILASSLFLLFKRAFNYSKMQDKCRTKKILQESVSFSHLNEFKIDANPGLAQFCFEQLGTGLKEG